MHDVERLLAQARNETDKVRKDLKDTESKYTKLKAKAETEKKELRDERKRILAEKEEAARMEAKRVTAASITSLLELEAARSGH